MLKINKYDFFLVASAFRVVSGYEHGRNTAVVWTLHFGGDAVSARAKSLVNNR